MNATGLDPMALSPKPVARFMITMNNKQLAILLNSIATSVELLAENVAPLIEVGDRTLVKTWVGDGPEPENPATKNKFQFPGLDPLIQTAYRMADNPDPYYLDKNWAYKPTGELLAVIKIQELADDLREQAKSLRDKKK